MYSQKLPFENRLILNYRLTKLEALHICDFEFVSVEFFKGLDNLGNYHINHYFKIVH